MEFCGPFHFIMYVRVHGVNAVSRYCHIIHVSTRTKAKEPFRLRHLCLQGCIVPHNVQECHVEIFLHDWCV